MTEININKKIFFKKYKLKKIMYKSLNSQVYEGLNIKENEAVAMKFEKNDTKFKLLESEAYALFHLKGFGIPKFITFGISGNYKVLIEELLGPSLNKLMILKRNKKMNELLKDVCMIGLQILDRLEYVHFKNLVHRDIKPENFLIGKNNPKIIYLIDFGLSRKYRSSRTGKHIKFKHHNSVFGSFRYMSINANKGDELSRRDDLISFGYMIIYLLKYDLPWMKIEKLKLMKNILNKEILKIKSSTSPNELCKGLPDEFRQFMQYINQLEFEQEPNYGYLKSLFKSVLQKNEMKIDFLFSWIKIKRQQNLVNKLVNTSNYKKGSCHKRLYDQIKNSLEKSKSQEQTIKFNFGLEKVKINQNESQDVNFKISFKKKINDGKKIFNINRIIPIYTNYKTNDDSTLNNVTQIPINHKNEVKKIINIKNKNIPKIKKKNIVNINISTNNNDYNEEKTNCISTQNIIKIKKINNNYNIFNVRNRYNILNNNINKNYSNLNIAKPKVIPISNSVKTYRTFREREKLKIIDTQRSFEFGKI